jgi:hypothetical protein
MKIIAYKKYTDRLITRTLLLPVDKTGQMLGTELATLADGLTYVSIPSVAKLPAQPKEIKATVATVVLTAVQLAEVKSVSPHVKLINDRVSDRIRERYSLNDELKLARISIGDLRKSYAATPAELQAVADYQVTVEAARAWGRTEKARLGL